MTEGICIRVLKRDEELWVGAVRIVVLETGLNKTKLAIQAPPEEKIEIVRVEDTYEPA